MGVTTLILAALFHRWLFRPMQSFLLLSAKEDRVDDMSDPSCLFWRLDHMLDCLPKWMRPPIEPRVHRKLLTLVNPETGSVFNGESTNANADRGGVRTAVMADEVGAMPNAESVIDAIGPLTESLFLVSTPQGQYGAFYKKYQDWLVDAPDRIILLHWTMHQEFSKGMYFTDEAVDGYSHPSWNGRKPRSPWYDKECLKLTSKRRISQELDVAFHGAGGPYFEPELIERLLKSARQPAIRGELQFDRETLEPKWEKITGGRLMLWCQTDGAKPAEGEYVAACDIASGKGGEMSSQSVIVVYNAKTGEKAAEYKNSRIAPESFAWYAVAICKWFHDAKLIWGSQGPGSTFGKVVVEDCRYHRIYWRGDVESVANAKSKKWGYVEIGASREILFGNYRDALTEDRCRNFSEEAIKELRQFIYSPDGSIQHSNAIQKDTDPENKGKLHGDIVVADALAWQLLKQTLKSPLVARKQNAPRYGTFAWRMKEEERRRNSEADWSVAESTW